MMNPKGINRKNKHSVQYLNILSAIRPIIHGPDILLSEPDVNIECSSDSEHSDMTVVAEDDVSKPEEDNQPVPLTQAEINDQTWDLNLQRSLLSYWGSHLKEKHLLAPKTTFFWYRFHQDNCIMEECYQGQRGVNFLANYCWYLKWMR